MNTPNSQTPSVPEATELSAQQKADIDLIFLSPKTAPTEKSNAATPTKGENPKKSKQRSKDLATRLKTKADRMEWDAGQMGVRHPKLQKRLQKRAEGIHRQTERAPLVQERDLFGQEGENPTGFPSKGHRLNSATAECRLREAYDLGLSPKPGPRFLGLLFLVPSRFDQSLRGKGDGLSGDPMDPYAVAHAFGRVTRLVGTPSRMVSVSLCGEMGGPGWEGEGDSTLGPVGHILNGVGLDCPVYDIHPLLFVNGQMPITEIKHLQSALYACEGLTLELPDGQADGPTVILRHLPLVADRFGARKFMQTVMPEMVRRASNSDCSILLPVEVCHDFDSYLMSLVTEMLVLAASDEIKPGTVLILIVSALNPLEQAVREGLTTDNRWSLLESFIAVEEHRDEVPRHAHDGRPLRPHRVLIWQKNQLEGDTSTDKLAVDGGEE